MDNIQNKVTKETFSCEYFICNKYLNRVLNLVKLCVFVLLWLKEMPLRLKGTKKHKRLFSHYNCIIEKDLSNGNDLTYIFL